MTLVQWKDVKKYPLFVLFMFTTPNLSFPGARPVLLPRAEPRLVLLPAEGRAHLQQARRVHQGRVLEEGIPGGK